MQFKKCNIKSAVCFGMSHGTNFQREYYRTRKPEWLTLADVSFLHSTIIFVFTYRYTLIYIIDIFILVSCIHLPLNEEAMTSVSWPQHITARKSIVSIRLLLFVALLTTVSTPPLYPPSPLETLLLLLLLLLRYFAARLLAGRGT